MALALKSKTAQAGAELTERELEAVRATVRAVMAEQAAGGKLVVNVQEASKLLGLADKTVYALTHRADFPALRVNSRVLIPVERLREWLEAHLGEVIEA